MSQLSLLNQNTVRALHAWKKRSKSHTVFFPLIDYLLSTGGKYFRPQLCQALANDIAGVPISDSVLVALELLHQASLVHDDLPSLDNDEIRRGMPSIHKQFSPGKAVLFGDFLFAEALRVVEDDKTLHSDISRKVVAELISAQISIAEGQYLDIEGAFDMESLYQISLKKTSALIEATARIALHFCMSDHETFNLITRWARYVGLIFQVIDDSIDVYGTEEVRGKPEAADIRNKKFTYFIPDPQYGLSRMKFLFSEVDAIVNTLQHNDVKLSLAIELYSMMRKRVPLGIAKGLS